MTSPLEGDPADFWRGSAGLAAVHGVDVLMTGGGSRAESGREVEAILALIPPLLPGDTILEPAAGAGRFTAAFAGRASKVYAWDLVPEFADENRRRCAGLPNVHIDVADARRLVIPGRGRIGLVFVKWLLMYLGDDDAEALLARLVGALRPGGHLFLHESCDPECDVVATPWTGEWLGATYRAYYRPPAYYRTLLARLTNPLGASVTEHDLDHLYDVVEPSSQRAWLVTLGDQCEGPVP